MVTLHPAIDSYLKNQSSPFGKYSIQEIREQIDKMQFSQYKSDVKVTDLKVDKVPIHTIRPSSVKNPSVLVYIHGGGWCLGSFKQYNSFLPLIAINSGVAIIFVDYSLSPEVRYPVAINEIWSVIEYLLKNSKELDLDTNNLSIGGDSAGGNLAIAISLMAKEKKITFKKQILLCPVTDASMTSCSYKEFSKDEWLSREMMELFWDCYQPDKSKRDSIDLSPINASVDQLTDLPSTLIVTCEQDVLRDEGEELGRKLMKAKNDISVVRLNGTIHNFYTIGSLSDIAPTKTVLDLIVASLK